MARHRKPTDGAGTAGRSADEARVAEYVAGPYAGFEPAYLAEIYWEMANKRDRAEVIPQATG